MKSLAALTLGMVVLACMPCGSRAEWGWPPLGYSTSGIRACDGACYKGLIATWRERRLARKCPIIPTQEAPIEKLAPPPRPDSRQ
jgi:hypothetical protein